MMFKGSTVLNLCMSVEKACLIWTAHFRGRSTGGEGCLELTVCREFIHGMFNTKSLHRKAGYKARIFATGGGGGGGGGTVPLLTLLPQSAPTLVT